MFPLKTSEKKILTRRQKEANNLQTNWLLLRPRLNRKPIAADKGVAVAALPDHGKLQRLPLPLR